MARVVCIAVARVVCIVVARVNVISVLMQACKCDKNEDFVSEL